MGRLAYAVAAQAKGPSQFDVGLTVCVQPDGTLPGTQGPQSRGGTGFSTDVSNT